MKIAISGASGFLGSALSKMFINSGHDVIKVARKDLYGDYIHQLTEKIDGVEVVINLAGATINRRWSSSYKEQILESRVVSTQKIVDVINHMNVKPKLFISASAVGYYSQSSYNDEQGAKGNGFLSYVCDNWENIAQRADSSVRTVIMRMGVVVSASGGAFSPLINMASRYHIVARIGEGNEVISWIELDDLLRLYQFIIDNENIGGVVNCVAPMSFTGSSMAKILSDKFGAITFTVPRKVVELAMGDRSEVLFNGTAVYPKIALDNGFKFKYSSVEEYVRSL